MKLVKIISYVIFTLLSGNINAQQKTDSIKKLLQKEISASKRVDLINGLSTLYNRKKPDSSIYYATIGLKEAKAINYHIGMGDSYSLLAWANFRKSNYNIADSLCKKSIEYYPENNKTLTKKKGDNYRLLAAINIERKNFEASLKHLLKVKDLYDNTSLDNDDLKANILNEIAYLYLQMDNYVISMKYLNKALNTAKDNNSSANLAQSYFILGTIDSNQEDYTKAIEHFNLSKQSYEAEGDLIGIASCNTKIGINHYYYNSYNDAIKFLNIAQKQSNDINYNFGVMENLIFLGKSYIKLNDFNNANTLLNTAQQIAKNHQIETSEIVLARSELALASNNYNHSSTLIEDHLLTKNTFINTKSKIDLYKQLSFIYKKSKQFEKSLNAKEQLFKLQDSINNIQDVLQTNLLQAEFDYEMVKQDLKNKEAKLVLAEEKEKNTSLINSILLLITIFLIIIFGLIYFKIGSDQKAKREIWETKQKLQKTKQEQLDSEISFKNKQITEFAIHISEKNELLLKLKKKINDLITKDKKINNKIKDIVLFLNNNLEQNKAKVSIYSSVSNTTDAFYHKLSELYPNLTEKEKRVAAFVRLDLTSKQIAIQLNISLSSIENYRYSLRKKMSTPKEIELNKFLKDI